MEITVFVTAIALLCAVVAYHVVTTLADLFPLNNVRDAAPAERRKEVAVNEPIMLVPVALLVLAAATSLPVLAYCAGAFEFVLAMGGIVLWWTPYLFGRSVPWATAGTGVTWSDLHARTYAQTVIILPPRAGRPRPNLEHMILHGLMVVAAAACIWYATTI